MAYRLPRRGLAAGLLLTLFTLGACIGLEPSPIANDMVTAHNAYRKALGLPPLNWSGKLAADAQVWAETLLKRRAFYHQPNSWYGENLFELRGNGSATPEDVVHDWASESLDYHYPTNGCSSMCGHYTQMVWRSTTEVGCATARNGAREIWVCRYNPPGNVVGQRPY